MAICYTVVYLAHFNIHKAFITLMRPSAIRASRADTGL